MKILTFHTSDEYRVRAEGLKASAEAFDLECILIEKPDLGSWWQNCNQKCEVILEALHKYGNEPIIWNDSDCRYIREPILFNGLSEFDLACVFLNGDNHPFGGTIYFNGKRAIPYVEAWACNVRKFPTHEDDSNNFKVALQRIRPRNIYRLPPSYCWRESDMRSALPGAKPVIVHTTDGSHNYPVGYLDEEEVKRLYV